jgi:hypothetical protein
MIGRRVGVWSPEEAARELHQRRPELIGELRHRGGGRGLPVVAQEEVVDDAITAVVMSPRVIANEHHLLGAFWLAVEYRCRRYREGRGFARLGSRVRVQFDTALAQVEGSVNPFERVEVRDRFARAADLMAELSPREREVLAVMATYGVGPVPASRLLDLPLGEVRSAARSASVKLNRVAAIAAAGRMCEFRSRAIAAHAAGEASNHEAYRAQAHVRACVRCGRVYRRLRREMRGREFQRAASAAFLPVPAVSLLHTGGLGKLAVWVEQRLSVFPRGGGERAAETLGGAGIVKAAAAGSAIVVAGSALTGHVLHEITAPTEPHRHAHTARIPVRPVADPVALARAPLPGVVASPRRSNVAAQSSRPRVTAHRSSQAPPSKNLGYLALGGSSAGGSVSTTGGSSSPVRATAASVGRSNPESSSEAQPQPTQSGGDSNLSYLGK